MPAVVADDYAEAVTWLFVSLEAAVAAIAERHGIVVPPNHVKKMEVARQLHADGHASVDYSAALRTLNGGRKAAVYDGDEPDLGGRSLDDLAAEVEQAVALAELNA